jgi:hypothetical protein
MGGERKGRREEERGGRKRRSGQLTQPKKGKVQVYDIKKHLAAMDNGSTSASAKKDAPKYQVNSHKNEGYALDWSPTVMGRYYSVRESVCVCEKEEREGEGGRVTVQTPLLPKRTPQNTK